MTAMKVNRMKRCWFHGKGFRAEKDCEVCQALPKPRDTEPDPYYCGASWLPESIPAAGEETV